MRSLAGAIFPLFATYMFDGIGIDWLVVNDETTTITTRLCERETQMQRHANAVMRDDRGMTLLGCFAALFIPMVSTHTIMIDRRRRRTRRHFTNPCNPFLLNILAIHILLLRYVLHLTEIFSLSSLIPPTTLI